MEQDNLTRLTKTDLETIEARVQAEAAAVAAAPDYEHYLTQEMRAVGPMPTIDRLKAEGHTEQRWLISLLDFIGGAGRVLTLLIAETIQSGAALIIGVVFAVLEYWRVFHGAEALGQVADQASLIAFAVVVANVVHPIYRLRAMQGTEYHEAVQWTLRGAAAAVWHRITGRPQTEQRAWNHNPVLDIAAVVITLTTVFLAVYDLIAPLLTSILTGTADQPMLILVMQLVMGLGLSLAGVFFLQAAAHEIGVRTLTDQPVRLADIADKRKAGWQVSYADAQHRAQEAHQQAQEAHQQALVEIRERITREHMAGKIADQQRRAALRASDENFTPAAVPVSRNGSNGRH